MSEWRPSKLPFIDSTSSLSRMENPSLPMIIYSKLDDYIAKKGPIPTKSMAKSGDVKLHWEHKGGEIKHTKKSGTQKHSPDKTTGGYKPSSVVAKTQKKTLHGGKLSSSQKKLDTLAKEKEKIRNSNMTMKQKKDAMTALNKKKEAADIRAAGQKKSSEHLDTPEGQAAYQKKVKERKDISKKRKAGGTPTKETRTDADKLKSARSLAKSLQKTTYHHNWKKEDFR